MKILAKYRFSLLLLFFLPVIGMTANMTLQHVEKANIKSDLDEIITVKPYQMQQYDQTIKAYYAQANLDNKNDRIKKTADYFLDAPYLLEPLGEGLKGPYSQEPLYRTDQFDCVSYVDTVLALYKAHNFNEFKQNILKVRYAGHQPHYIYRTDWFSDLEWFPNTQRLGWTQDVTDTIVDAQQNSLIEYAQTVIDKPNWYFVKPYKAMHLLEPKPTGTAAAKILEELRAHASFFEAQKSELSFIPIKKLFTNQQPNEYIFNQIPSGSVVAIVRPNWPIRDEFPGYPQGYGTNLNVSHLGLVIRTAEGLMFYNASSVQHRVMAEPLSDYLGRYIDSATVKGIHIEKII